ncbi:MAG: hypothetical protein LBH13_00760 [Cellulomonadaceae bacterium]|jgi:hypothetical protein|nr:hypothetical protein [Cellulomonadaceae bacterium]
MTTENTTAPRQLTTLLGCVTLADLLQTVVHLKNAGVAVKGSADAAIDASVDGVVGAPDSLAAFASAPGMFVATASATEPACRGRSAAQALLNTLGERDLSEARHVILHFDVTADHALQELWAAIEAICAALAPEAHVTYAVNIVEPNLVEMHHGSYRDDTDNENAGEEDASDESVGGDSDEDEDDWDETPDASQSMTITILIAE